MNASGGSCVSSTEMLSAVAGTTRTVSQRIRAATSTSRLDIVFASFRDTGDGTATLTIRTAKSWGCRYLRDVVGEPEDTASANLFRDFDRGANGTTGPRSSPPAGHRSQCADHVPPLRAARGARQHAGDEHSDGRHREQRLLRQGRPRAVAARLLTFKRSALALQSATLNEVEGRTSVAEGAPPLGTFSSHSADQRLS
jgi:hypothetical protein